MPLGALVGVIALATVLFAVVVVNVLVRRKGYAIPGRTAVRCGQGHLYRETWIEGGSFTAVRLGPLRRYERCPIGHHWSIVHPVRDDELMPGEREALVGRDRTGLDGKP